MPGTPLVSVCVPARGAAQMLVTALRSVLAERDLEMEVLVHDDGSERDPARLVAALGDPRIRFRRHSRPLGVAQNRNTCLDAARGRYVAWLDADDVRLPGGLAAQVAMLEAEPAIGMVHGGFEVIDAGGARLSPWPAPFERDTVEPSAVAFSHLIASNEITTSTVVVRRSLHAAVGPFTGAAGASSSDWDMWLRLALRADVGYVSGPVAQYRQHPATISHATTRSGERLRCDLRVARRVLQRERSRVPDPRRARAVARAALAAKALTQAGDAHARGERAAAARAVAVAVRSAPRSTGADAVRLLLATARADDCASYAATKRVAGRLAVDLEGTRFGARVRAAAESDPEWEATLRRIAARIRATVPAGAVVATAAKWDPTLHRLSERRGPHFPDLRLLPEGYPREERKVVEHVEELRRAGVTHLVFTSATDWWLEHYPGLAGHLARHRVAWRDADCLIYDLSNDVMGAAGAAASSRHG